LTDLDHAITRQLAAAEKQDTQDNEAIIKFANEVSEKIIEQGLPYNIVFNGLTIALTTFLLEYCVEDESKLNLERLDKAFEFFVKGLENSIRSTVEKLKADSDAAPQVSAIITGA
jgi:hypothetical protein